MKGGDLGEVEDQLEPADRARHRRAHPRGLRHRPAAAPRPLPPPVVHWRARRRSTPSPRSWSTASASCRRRCEHLLDVVEIKGLCRRAGIAQVDAGTEGRVITFRRNKFANPEGLVAFVQASRGRVKVQPDTRSSSRPTGTCPRRA